MNNESRNEKIKNYFFYHFYSSINREKIVGADFLNHALTKSESMTC
jgi:hypothetical protein